MTFEELKQFDEQYVVQTYSRNPIAIDHGQGATLYDLEGKEYIDFASGIGVLSVGTAHPKWQAAISAQAAKLGHISNLYYSEPYILLAQKLCTRSGMAAAFFANSGAESNEGLVKLARKYSFDKYGPGRGTVITLKNSFHGRTVTTLAATGQDVFHQYFFPFTEGFRHAAPSLDGVQEVAGHDVCAVLVELVQGEGGVLPLDWDFVRELAQLCEKRDWLLLVDEVQTGIGRTVSLFCFQQYGILPDACSFAKGVAGGLPMGGFLVNEKCRDVLGPGQHATTFGGNPVVCAAGWYMLSRLADPDFLAQVARKGEVFRRRLSAMPHVAEVRGLGMMLGVKLDKGSSREAAEKCLENGLLILTAKTLLRLLPPLNISEEEMDRGLSILESTLAAL